MSMLRRSMTGYGAGTAETPEYRVAVEIKAVNQRFLEIAPHMPRAFSAATNGAVSGQRSLKKRTGWFMGYSPCMDY